MFIINKINYLMEKKEIKNKELASVLGLTAQAVTDWRAGRSKSYTKYLPQIAAYFGVSIDYLTGSVGSLDNDLFRRLDALCKRKGITFCQAMERAGFTEKEIEHYYAGNRGIIFSHKKELSDILDDDSNWSDFAFSDNLLCDPVSEIISYEVIGTVAAGYDGEAVEEYTGEICEIPTSYLKGHKKEDYFVLRVVGDSMYPRLLNGDRVLVQRCTSVDSGDIAIVMYNGSEATLKKVEYVNGENWVDLIPFNPEYPTKHLENEELEECRILGKVRVLLREL